MTPFTPSYLYTVELSEGDGFQLTGHVWEPVIVVTNLTNPQSDTFEVGDLLSLTNRGIDLGNYTYLGAQADGIIARNPDSGVAWAISETPRSFDTVYTFNPEPFPVCFVKGTLITASRGPVAIEDLVEGDHVQGSTGWRTVKWVGWRNYGAASFLTEESRARIAPVRIRAHAIADNVPSNDLLTSPWHHLLVDGKLVRAGDLVNGTTITQETHLTEVSYYHVELDEFDVIMAHGVFSESWADGGNRSFFQNTNVAALRPEDFKRRRASRPGFDHLVLRKGKKLESIQKTLAERAQLLSTDETAIAKAA